MSFSLGYLLCASSWGFSQEQNSELCSRSGLGKGQEDQRGCHEHASSRATSFRSDEGREVSHGELSAPAHREPSANSSCLMIITHCVESAPLSSHITVATHVGTATVGRGRAEEAGCCTPLSVAPGDLCLPVSAGLHSPRHQPGSGLERNLLPSTTPTFLLRGMPLYGQVQVPWAGT